MKRAVRIIALGIGMVMLMSSFLSCRNDSSASADTVNWAETADLSHTTEAVSSSEDEGYLFEIVYPSVTASSLQFTLTDKKLEEYNGKMQEAERLFYQNEPGSEDVFRHALYELLSRMAEMETQRDIAYMQYCYDMSNSSAWDNYLYAYDLHDRAHDGFWALYNESKAQNGTLSTVFREVVQKEYGGNLVTVTPEADSYAYQMETFEGEYNSLKNSGASDEKIFAVYRKYLLAAYRFAKASSTANYYEYASRHRFFRNDTSAERELFRQYVKEYLVPICQELGAQSEAYDNRLSYAEYTLSNRYLKGKYDSFRENYLLDYFSSLPESAGRAMADAFEKDRILIGNKRNSYDTAMVYAVGRTPICYFHEDRTTLETMTHELGHYYASVAGDSAYTSFSLRETHSSANTQLFFRYLSDKLNNKAIKGAELYMLYNNTYQLISSVIKDEFDEIIYTRNPSTLTLAEFERIMSDLIEEYGVREISSSMVNQLMTYWCRLGIQYPMSNYCYAVAEVAALQIYIKSKSDYAAAVEMYRCIVEEIDAEGDFVATITKAGLTTPYQEQTYLELQRLKTPS